MDYLKTFESFSSFENARLDKTTIKFIDGSITESQFIDYLNTEVYNEGVMDDLKGFVTKLKTKFTDIFYTFIKKAAENGMIVFNSFKSFINTILDSLSKWKNDNPVLFKVIIITAMVVILLIVSAGTAHAQTTGTPVSVAHLDTAIGYLEKLKSIGGVEDNLQVMKAMARLIDLRDGVVDIPLDQFGKESVAMAKSAMTVTGDMIDQAASSQDKEAMNKCFDLMDAGAKYVDVVFKKAGSTESIKLIVSK